MIYLIIYYAIITIYMVFLLTHSFLNSLLYILHKEFKFKDQKDQD